MGSVNSALEGPFGEVLGPFVQYMADELAANAAKGDRDGWLSMTPQTATLEIYWHVAKLVGAVRSGDIKLIREHAADVANMSMMLLDVCGGIESDPNPQNATTDMPQCKTLGNNMVISDKTNTNVRYHVYYGPERMDERNIKTFSDPHDAMEFFTEKERTMHVDVFKVTSEVREIREKLT